jgi:hypothetical protein
MNSGNGASSHASSLRNGFERYGGTSRNGGNTGARAEGNARAALAEARLSDLKAMLRGHAGRRRRHEAGPGGVAHASPGVALSRAQAEAPIVVEMASNYC